MNLKLVTALLVLVVLFSGCIDYQQYLGGSEPEVSVDENGSAAPEEEQSAKELLDELHKEAGIGKDDVVKYLQDNPVAMFDGLDSRIDFVVDSGTNVSLKYTVSTNDPGAESMYLAGVLFMVYDDAIYVEVKGYNAEGKHITASHKYPTRDSYNFNQYPTWFPNYVYNECTENEDCDDNDICTNNICANNRCSNPRVFKEGCEV
ncbi:MAG: hypothetical protein ABIG20_04205 [archaeon]